MRRRWAEAWARSEKRSGRLIGGPRAARPTDDGPVTGRVGTPAPSERRRWPGRAIGDVRGAWGPATVALGATWGSFGIRRARPCATTSGAWGGPTTASGRAAGGLLGTGGDHRPASGLAVLGAATTDLGERPSTCSGNRGTHLANGWPHPGEPPTQSDRRPSLGSRGRPARERPLPGGGGWHGARRD